MVEKKSGTRYAVVDLEATGTGSMAKIIQVGIVILQDGEIVETYERDINPHEELSPIIQDLTGISNQRLRRAPSFDQVAEEIYRLIEDAVFVAHNVKFDGNLLAENLFFEGYDLLTPRVDTVELAQLFFPTLEKYSLVNLAEDLDLELEQAHTAISDALATAQLLLKIQEKIASLPKQTVGQILNLADHLIFETRMIIDQVYEEMSDYSNGDCQSVNGLMLRKEVTSLGHQPLSDQFSDNIHSLGLEARQAQSAFAQLVEERLKDEGQVHFIQAQAGIGKTYGYLLPLLAQTSQPLLVTVPTRILQQQIMEKEGRQLADTFPVNIQSIKSSKHFIKLETFWKTLQREDGNRLLNRYKMHILVWLCETQTGDMDELRQKQRYQSYFDELQHDGSLSAQSAFWEWDFWRRLHSKAQASHILLTNHAYFLHHLKDQPYLTEGRLLVIDEAQKLLLTAEEFTSQSLAVEGLLQHLQSRKDRSESLLERRLYESCFFELQQLILDFHSGGLFELRAEDLQQLAQNLQELPQLDASLADLKWLLDYYDRFWIEEDRSDDQNRHLLRASQMELLDVASLLPQTKTFCISATLELSKRVDLASLLGFSEVSTDILPCQKSQEQEVMLLQDLPELVEMDLDQQAYFIAERLQDLDGFEKPILTLFTSKALLLAVSEVLDSWKVAHLAQYKDGSEMVIKRRFERGECRILLGSGAFWEGVDFSSQDQMIQLIPRLPFENPRDPLVRKINQHLRQEGKQPFYDYNLPVMLLKLKQAIGRTKRHQEQVSAVILLDNRVLTKRYSRQIIRFLKDGYQLSTASLDNLLDNLDNFFSSQDN